MCLPSSKPPPTIKAPPAPAPVLLKEQQTPELAARKRSKTDAGLESLRSDLLFSKSLGSTTTRSLS